MTHLPTTPTTLPSTTPVTSAPKIHGTHMTRQNGHPNNPPTAVHTTPSTNFPSKNPAAAIMPVYIANVLGRNATAL